MTADQPEALAVLRNLLAARGASSIKAMGKKFRIMDDDGSRSLNFEEFFKGITDCGMDITKAQAQDLFSYLDKDKGGAIDFEEFLKCMRPEMSQARIDIIDEAFKKMDKTGDGVVTIADMDRAFNARDHPKYQSGEWDQARCFEEYLTTFEEPNNPDGKVTKEEFFNYYCGVSASYDLDEQFDVMMRNGWKI